MREINNYDIILPRLNEVWESTDIPVSFHVRVLQRSKDGIKVSNNNSVRTIAEWFVYDEERLRFLEPAIKSLCEIYQGRCYITINGKTDEMVLWKLTSDAMERLKNKQNRAKGLFGHSHDTCNGFGLKRWIVDVDDPFVDYDDLCNKIEHCQSGYINNIIAKIPTKNGYHIITHPFNLSQIQLPPGVDVKKNNSTLLYCIYE